MMGDITKVELRCLPARNRSRKSHNVIVTDVSACAVAGAEERSRMRNNYVLEALDKNMHINHARIIIGNYRDWSLNGLI